MIRYAARAGIACLAVLPGGVEAQALLGDGRTVFERPFFTRFAPQTAFDIVSRVPGFVLDEGDRGTRGFGAAAGNVVIDGRRPSAKSDTLQTILQRLPADRVARVEFGPGDVFGGEFRGRPQVLNVVTVGGGGLSGSYSAVATRVHRGRMEPAGQGSVLYKTGNHTLTANLAYDNDPRRENGEDFITALPSGALVERRDKTNIYTTRGPRASGSWEYGADGGTYRLNGQIAREDEPLFQRNFVTRPGQPVRFDTLTQDPHDRTWELGGDATRPLWGGEGKLIALVTRRRFTGLDVLTFGALTDRPTGIRQGVAERSGESILRGTFSRPLGRWTLEVGGEGAINTLDSDVSLANFAGDAVTPVDLPIDDVAVRERRGEGYVAVTRDLAKTVRTNAVLAYEYSRLTVSGDADARRALGFLKPKLSVEWTASKRLRLQGLVERQVGQLDFGDFVSAAEITNERINGGNADLRPERTWHVEGTVQRSVLGDGIAKLVLAYDRVTAVQDRVPTEDGFDAPGNLGTGTRATARLTLDAPLAPFGFAGARLTVDALGRQTRVRDPNDGRDRRFSGESPWFVNAGLRQDLPKRKMAWGVSYYAEGPITVFRRNELDTVHPGGDSVDAFVEYRPSKALTVRLDVLNLADREVLRRRTFYADRRLAPVSREDRVRRQSETVMLTLKGTFG